MCDPDAMEKRHTAQIHQHLHDNLSLQYTLRGQRTSKAYIGHLLR
jgi:hypothetical protein